MKKIAAIAATVFVTIILALTAYAAKPSVIIDGNAVSLKTEPYENKLGVMADARELADAFGIEYSFDAEKKSFSMYDEAYGDIILMHNATEFYSGGNIFECLPYFYVENDIPMVEAGFFCKMFGKSCSFTDGVLEIKDGISYGLMSEEDTLEEAVGGSVAGTVSAASADYINDIGIDVTLSIKTHTKTKYSYYGVPSYTAGERYDLGTVHIDKSNEPQEFSYSLAEYYDESYPYYTLFYETDSYSPYVRTPGYFTTDNGIGAMADFNVLDKVIKDAKDFNAAEDYTDVNLVLPVNAGVSSLGVKWSFDQSTGKLTLSGSGTVLTGAAWDEFKDLVKSIDFEWTSALDIGQSAFKNYTALETVNLKGTTQAIHANAFYGCTALEKINLPNTTTSIDESAFEGCTALETVEFLYGSKLATIGDRAFYGCHSLKSFTFPNTLSTIGNYAFYYCNSLTELDIPKLKAMGEYAFAYCSKLESVKTPSNLASIPTAAFYRCLGLKKVDIAKGVNKIGSSAFYSCGALETITIPDSVTHIYENAFRECVELSDVTLADNLKYIGSSAFKDCAALQSIVIPDSVTTLGSRIFEGCTALASVTLPKNLTAVPSSAFSGCKWLTDITVPDGVTEIQGWAFEGCTRLRTVELADTIESIGGWAFYGCSSLTRIVLPENLTDGGSFAFMSCTALKEIVFNSKLKETGLSGMFSDCTSLESVTIPANIQKITASTFGGCKRLTDIHLKGVPVFNQGVDKGQVVTVHYLAENEALMGNIMAAYPDFIYVADEEAEPVQTAAPTPTVTPILSPTATPTATPSPTAKPTATASPSPTPVTIPAETDIPSATPTTEPTPAPAELAEVTVLLVPTDNDKNWIFEVQTDRDCSGSYIYATVFSDDGELIGINGARIENYFETVYVNRTENDKYAKIFVWDSLEGMRPISYTATVELQ